MPPSFSLDCFDMRMVGGRGNRQDLANWLDPVLIAVRIDEAARSYYC